MRRRAREKANAGDTHAKATLTVIRQRQDTLVARRNEAIAVVRREPALVAPGEVTFIAHTLVVPTSDPEERRRHDADVEAIAVQIARAYEEELHAHVRDVSTRERALAANLQEYPGYDLHSRRPDGSEIAIEVKGRAATGDVEMTDNEYSKACTLGERYWLYVVFDCATARPRLHRVQDPFRKLIARAKGSVLIDDRSIVAAAEKESG